MNANSRPTCSKVFLCPPLLKGEAFTEQFYASICGLAVIKPPSISGYLVEGSSNTECWSAWPVGSHSLHPVSNAENTSLTKYLASIETP